MASTAISAATGLLGSISTSVGSALGTIGSSAGELLDGLDDSMFGSAEIGASSIVEIQLSSASGIANSLLGDTSDSGLFVALSSALNGTSKLGSTAFGVVSNVSSSSVGLTENVSQTSIGSSTITTSPVTTLLGGVLDKGMKTAFPAVGNAVAKAGNMIGGVMTMNGDLESTSLNNISGKINQSI